MYGRFSIRSIPFQWWIIQQQQWQSEQWYRQMSMSSDCKDILSTTTCIYALCSIFFRLSHRSALAAYSIFLTQWKTSAMSSLATNAHDSIEIKPFDFTSLSFSLTHSPHSLLFITFHSFQHVRVRIATVVLSYLLILLSFLMNHFYEPFGVNFYSLFCFLFFTFFVRAFLHQDYFCWKSFSFGQYSAECAVMFFIWTAREYEDSKEEEEGKEMKINWRLKWDRKTWIFFSLSVWRVLSVACANAVQKVNKTKQPQFVYVCVCLHVCMSFKAKIYPKNYTLFSRKWKK